MLIGYARVSTEEQDTAMQRDGNYPPPCQGVRPVIHTTDEARGT